MKKSILLSLIYLATIGFGQDVTESADIGLNDSTPTITDYITVTTTTEFTGPTNAMTTDPVTVNTIATDSGEITPSNALPTTTPAVTLTTAAENTSEMPSSTIDSVSSETGATTTPVATHTPYVPPTVSPSVCKALQNWYNSLNGKNWLVSSGWDSSNMTSCCDWYSVHCNSIGKVLKV
ncbi:hypothetical protein G6F43_012721 [Rhizopus delemar]|nr:hypothetical protein G6F43_012721 [Rhizopus delemar]